MDKYKLTSHFLAKSAIYNIEKYDSIFPPGLWKSQPLYKYNGHNAVEQMSIEQGFLN